MTTLALIYRFMELPTVAKIEIATNLGLATVEDYKRQKKGFATWLLLEAKAKGKLELVWEKVVAYEPTL